MRRPLAGKAAFYAMGQRARAYGKPMYSGEKPREQWPMWARLAFTKGYQTQFWAEALLGRRAA